MIPLIIVLSVVAALALIGVIVFCVLRGKKKSAGDNIPVALDVPQTSEQEAAPIATEAPTAPVASETQTAAADEQGAETADTAESDAARSDSSDEVVRIDEHKDEGIINVDGRKADEIVNVDEQKDDEASKAKPVADSGKKPFVAIKYSRSFLAKLIQSDDRTKRYYSELKSKFMLYDGVKSRITWKCETFRKGRKTLAKLRLRGKTPSVALALDPNDYAATEYRVESLGEIKSYAKTPCLYRIKSNRRLAYAKELIEELATKNSLLEKTDVPNTDYAAQYPYEETDALIRRKLIKVLKDKTAKPEPTFDPSDVRESVTATEVDKIMSDEVAVSLIEKSDGKTDKTKQGIINIDVLSQNFESGEVVTLDEIKKRVKGFNQKTTYIKVLARGTLDKPLTVEADTFSIQAVKMIVLTGGKVIKKR